MVRDLNLLYPFQRPGNQLLPIQIPLGVQHLTQGGLGLGMLGGKDSAAVLIGQDGGIQRADAPGDGDNLLLVHA